MIPYWEWVTISLGPLHLQTWGLFVALGFLVGGAVAAGHWRRRGDDPAIIWDMLPWCVLAGMVGGRLGHVVLYQPAYYLAHPLEALMIWDGGLSFFGGLIAAVAVGWAIARRRNVNILGLADSIAFGLPAGEAIGRIGCFLIHDHPGTATDFFLGIRYPDGIVRHDLGLEIALASAGITLLFFLLARKERPAGWWVAVYLVAQGAMRLALDTLRIVDVRYAGLTPGQWISLGLIIAGITLWITLRRKPPAPGTMPLAK